MSLDHPTPSYRPDVGSTMRETEQTPHSGGETPEVRVLPSEYYLQRLSTISRMRKPSPIWDLFSVEANPGMLSMLAGKPHPSTFPFEHITLGVRSPDSDTVMNLELREGELDTALQYGMTAGIPELVQWVTGMTEEVHSRGSGEGWRVSFGAGSQDLLYKAFNALLNPGDTILVEGPTYPTVIPILDALECHYAIVDSDDEGICATDLEKILCTWDRTKPFPRVLYTVPFGSNPAGVTTSHGRRMDILRLARQHDLLILEDDPYYFLYYGEQPRPPSYFSLEKQMGGEVGRVLRFDSFSKIISAGFRLGWMTGPEALLTPIERHNAVSVVQPSSLSQVIILKLLKQWGLSGFLAHTSRTADFYRRRRDLFAAYLDKHLTGLAEWTLPDASMFFWLKLHLPPTLDCQNGNRTTEGDSTVFIRDKAISRGVLVLPGATAFPDGRQTARVRLSFSLLPDEEMEEAIKRLAVILKEERTPSIGASKLALMNKKRKSPPLGCRASNSSSGSPVKVKANKPRSKRSRGYKLLAQRLKVRAASEDSAVGRRCPMIPVPVEIS